MSANLDKEVITALADIGIVITSAYQGKYGLMQLNSPEKAQIYLELKERIDLLTQDMREAGGGDYQGLKRERKKFIDALNRVRSAGTPVNRYELLGGDSDGLKMFDWTLDQIIDFLPALKDGDSFCKTAKPRRKNEL